MSSFTLLIAAALIFLAGDNQAPQITTNTPSSNAKETRQKGTDQRLLSGYILTQQDERLPGITVIARVVDTESRTTSDANGEFRVVVPVGPVTLRLEGQKITPIELPLSANEPGTNLTIRVKVIIPTLQES